MLTLCQLELLFAKFNRHKCRNILQNRMFRVFRHGIDAAKCQIDARSLLTQPQQWYRLTVMDCCNAHALPRNYFALAQG